MRVLVFGCGVDRLPPWTRTHIRPASRRGWRRWWPSSRSWPPRPLDGLADGARAERVRRLRGLAGPPRRPVAGRAGRRRRPGGGRGRGGPQAGSTAGWLRNRLRMGAGAAAGAVRTARALFGGPLTATGQALTDGEISPAHAQVLAHGTQELPDHLAAEAEPALLDAARRLDPPRLRRVVGHLWRPLTPRVPRPRPNASHLRRGLWVSPTLEGMVAVDGLLEPEAGQIVLAALEPLARPADATDTRSGSQRRADALTELARRNLEAGQLPQSGGVRPQLLVTVDLDSLLGHHPGTWGVMLAGWGRWPPEACRRLACDGAVTRVLVTRHPTGHHHDHHGTGPDGPDPRRPRPRRPRRRWRLGGLAPGGGQAAPPSPWWRPHPTPGARPHHPGRHRRPTRRPGRARRRLCGGRLPATPSLVRSPPSPPLAPWRPHRPGRIWPWSAEPTTGRSMRAGGG